MGFYVHINVCFACDTNEGVAVLAKKYLERPILEANKSIEAQWFLEDLSNRNGYNNGPKGGLSTWGIVGNYTQGEIFIEQLREFWKELLSGVDGGPHKHEHILVFVEKEGSQQATAFEIFLDPDKKDSLKILQHICPFSWHQV